MPPFNSQLTSHRRAISRTRSIPYVNSSRSEPRSVCDDAAARRQLMAQSGCRTNFKSASHQFGAPLEADLSKRSSPEPRDSREDQSAVQALIRR